MYREKGTTFAPFKRSRLPCAYYDHGCVCFSFRGRDAWPRDSQACYFGLAAGRFPAAVGTGQLLTPYHHRRSLAPAEFPLSWAFRFQCCQPQMARL